jgi:hypothetical protein
LFFFYLFFEKSLSLVRFWLAAFCRFYRSDEGMTFDSPGYNLTSDKPCGRFPDL